MSNHLFRYSNLLIVTLIVLSGFFFTPATAEIVVDPSGLAFSLDANEEAVQELYLVNHSENDVAFTVNYRAAREAELINRGPQRDDIGDDIAEYQIGGDIWAGLGWDGALMWGIGFEEGVLIAFDPVEEEIVQRINLGFQAIGMAYDGENFWVGCFEGDRGSLVLIDNQGDELDRINVNALIVFGLAFDGENLWYSGLSAEGELEGIVEMTTEGDVLNNYSTDNFAQGGLLSLAWVPEHEEGHLWAVENEILTQLNVVENDLEIVQQVNINQNESYGLEHDSENLWHGSADGMWYVIDDGILEPKWLTIEPAAGEIPADSEEEIDLLINSEDIEAGVHEMRVVFGFEEMIGDEVFSTEMEISVVLSVESDVAAVGGIITDAATDDAAADAKVTLDNYLMTRFSNNGGEYLFENLPLRDYQLAVSATDYLPQTVDVSLDEAGEVDLNIALLHSECIPEIRDVNTEMAPDEQSEIRFNVSNPGNGPLSYCTNRRLPGNADQAPWDLRDQYFIGETVDDDRIQGVIYAGDHFFAAGANDGQNLIYVLNSEGELIRSFDQPDEDRRGMRDLAFDGRLIWGSIGSRIYGITTDGEVEYEWESPYNPTVALAWDSDRQILWLSSTTTNPLAFTREGEPFEDMSISRRDLRIYGLAYYPDDPDQFNLYTFVRERNESMAVYKFNPETDDTMFVSTLDPEQGGIPGGACITNDLDIYSWVMLTISGAGVDQGGDRMDVWQIDSRRDWMQIEPSDGIIETGGDQDFVLTLSSIGLPAELFEGEIVFTHDGVGGETVLPISMNVVAGPVHAERILQLDIGWNLVSVNLAPDDDDVTVILRDLVDAGIFTMMKNGIGQFYRPEFNFNNIPGWDVTQGYQIKMEEAAELVVEGITVLADDPIQLGENWNMISYFPRQPVDAILALSGIEEQLLIAKDGMGHFYNPEFGFSNMGNMREGLGYQVKVREAVELIYTLDGGNAIMAGDVWRAEKSIDYSPNFLSAHQATGENMSVLILAEAYEGADIGIYAGEVLVGSGSIIQGRCGLAVWGDDKLTDEIDGALPDQQLEVYVYENSLLQPVAHTLTTGKNHYRTDDFQLIELDQRSEITEGYGIVSAYPNPFNGRISIKFNLEQSGPMDIALFDYSGRLVQSVFSGEKASGFHQIEINAEILASGIYFIELREKGHNYRQKVTLLK